MVKPLPKITIIVLIISVIIAIAAIGIKMIKTNIFFNWIITALFLFIIFRIFK